MIAGQERYLTFGSTDIFKSPCSEKEDCDAALRLSIEFIGKLNALHPKAFQVGIRAVLKMV